MNFSNQLRAVGWRVLGITLCAGGQVLQATAIVVRSCGKKMEQLGQHLKTPAPPQE